MTIAAFPVAFWDDAGSRDPAGARGARAFRALLLLDRYAVFWGEESSCLLSLNSILLLTLHFVFCLGTLEVHGMRYVGYLCFVVRVVLLGIASTALIT